MAKESWKDFSTRLLSVGQQVTASIWLGTAEFQGFTKMPPMWYLIIGNCCKCMSYICFITGMWWEASKDSQRRNHLTASGK